MVVRRRSSGQVEGGVNDVQALAAVSVAARRSYNDPVDPVDAESCAADAVEAFLLWLLLLMVRMELVKVRLVVKVILRRDRRRR